MNCTITYFDHEKLEEKKFTHDGIVKLAIFQSLEKAADKKVTVQADSKDKARMESIVQAIIAECSCTVHVTVMGLMTVWELAII